MTEVRRRTVIPARLIALLRSRHAWALVVGGLLAVYLAVNFGLPRVPRTLVSAFVKSYVVQPLLWAGLAALVFGVSHYGPEKRRLSFRRALLGIGLLLGGFQVSVLAIAGLFTTFGRSPYTLSFPGVLYNLFFWSSTLLAFELTRAYLLNLVGRRFMTLALIGLGLALAFIDLPWVRYTTLSGIADTVPSVGGTFVPLAGEHILASYLALEGGPVAAIAYRGIMEAFEWYMPVLPDPPWIVKGFIGVVVPIIGLMVIQALYVAPAKPAPAEGSASEAHATPEATAAPQKTKKKKKRGLVSRTIGWSVVVALSVVIVLFGMGTFDVRPGVVLTGSMSPAINAGDIVLTQVVPAEEIQVGDVIKYQLGQISIWHRVLEVRPNGTQVAFITKGDANDSIDPRPILPEQLEGKVVFVIPKLGKLSLFLKDLLNRES